MTEPTSIREAKIQLARSVEEEISEIKRDLTDIILRIRKSASDSIGLRNLPEDLRRPANAIEVEADKLDAAVFNLVSGLGIDLKVSQSVNQQIVSKLQKLRREDD